MKATVSVKETRWILYLITSKLESRSILLENANTHLQLQSLLKVIKMLIIFAIVYLNANNLKTFINLSPLHECHACCVIHLLPPTMPTSLMTHTQSRATWRVSLKQHFYKMGKLPYNVIGNGTFFAINLVDKTSDVHVYFNSCHHTYKIKFIQNVTFDKITFLVL